MLAVLQLDEFQNVKYLCLKHFDSLAHIHCRNNISFPKLERLEVRKCHCLQYVFFFFVSLAGGSSTVACPDDEEEEISRRIHKVIKFPYLYDLAFNLWNTSLTFAVAVFWVLSSFSYGKCTSIAYLSSKISGIQPTTPLLTQILFLMKRFLVPTWKSYLSIALTT